MKQINSYKTNPIRIWNISVIIMISILSASCKKESKSTGPSSNTTSIDTNMIVVPANNTNIVYMGRIDFTDPKAPLFAYSGVNIQAKFQGTSIDVIIQDYAVGGSQHTNYYNILIDSSLYTNLQVNSNDTLYKIARNLTNTSHTIEIFKKTEAQVGSSAFKGFRVLANTTLLPAGVQPTRKIEFIGDSYTCGYGDDTSIAAPPAGNPTTGFSAVYENNYKAWGATVCRYFNAQYHCTAFSGRGMYRNNNASTSGTLPLIYNQTNPNNPSTLWSTANYIPDLVVIHLGTNDFAPEQTSSPSMVDSATFVSTYVNFITTLRSYYPSTKIICVVPNSETDYYPVGFKTLTRLTSYINSVVNACNNNGDSNVFYFALTPQLAPYGQDWHPTAATQLSMANQIEPFIKSTLGW